METVYEMWEKLNSVDGNDNNVQKDKVDSLGGKYIEMKMQGEDIEKYDKRVKDLVLSIKDVRSTLHEEDVVRKILKT